MSRQWTARKATTLDEAAVGQEAVDAAYPLFRPGPEPAAAGKDVLRLALAYTLIGLPLHCGVHALAAHSLGLAAGSVLVVVALLLAVALARWLGLDDLLQKLPLVLVLGLAGVALVFFTSGPTKRPGTPGVEFFGTVLLLIVAVSVLSSLYRPLAASYQAVTTQMGFRDLGVAAAGLAASLGLAALGTGLNAAAARVLAFTLVGGWAGLVVIEYAAWARANPARSVRPPGGPEPRGHLGGALLGALGTGFSLGVFVTVVGDRAAGRGDAPLGVVAASLGGFIVGTVWTAAALDALRRVNPFLALRVAWDALALFLTYPHPAHPLAHRLSTRWLRPPAVRLTLTALTLAAVATSGLVAGRSPASPDPKSTTGGESAPSGFRPGRGGETTPPATFGTPGIGPNPYATPSLPQYPVETPPADPGPLATPPDVAGFVVAAVVFATAPPAALYLFVWLVGTFALPLYFDRFERSAGTRLSPANPTH